MKKITSLTNQHIKELSELKKAYKRKETQQFLVEGEDFLLLAYEKHRLVEILTLEYLPSYQDVEQIIVTKEILEKLSFNKSPASVIGLCLFVSSQEIKGNKLLYLDAVQDPGNVGTLIRTAVAFNYDGVLLSSECASIYNEKVIASSKGAIFKINLYENVDLLELKKLNYTLISTSLKEAENYRKYSFKSNFVLVLGNEGQGVKKENLAISDYIVKIEMSEIDSLNVGIAGGILMNEYR